MGRMVRLPRPLGLGKSLRAREATGAIPSSPPFSGQSLICSGDWPPRTLSSCPGRNLLTFMTSPQDPSAFSTLAGSHGLVCRPCGVRALLFAFS
jgi:hypothetical protein